MFELCAGLGEGSTTGELSFHVEARMLARGSIQEMVIRLTNMFHRRSVWLMGYVFQLISQIALAWISSPCPRCVLSSSESSYRPLVSVQREQGWIYASSSPHSITISHMSVYKQYFPGRTNTSDK